MFVFFKQKTAYEVRIRDWSSDVCSSDLRLAIERHMRLLRRPAALLQVARRAGGGDIFPARPPAQPPRHDMIEGQFLARSTILAGEAVAQKQVEADRKRVG